MPLSKSKTGKYIGKVIVLSQFFQTAVRGSREIIEKPYDEGPQDRFGTIH